MRPQTGSLAIVGAALLAACATTRPPDEALSLRHRRGTDFLLARFHQGVPIEGESLFWDGEGNVSGTGIGGQAGHYLVDNVALGLGTNLTGWWTPGDNVFSVELEPLIRWHPFDGGPLFLDGTVGYLRATDPIPPDGTNWNFSFGFGGGLEFPMADRLSLLVGAHYHHISNGRGASSSNPTENELRFWVGTSWTF